METLSGLCGAPGYAVGTAVVKKNIIFELSPYKVENHDEEISRFRAAQAVYSQQLGWLQEQSEKELGAETAGIFGAYQIILNDEAFFQKAITRLASESISLAYLIDDECSKVIEMLTGMDDPHLRDRAVDIENVCRKLCRIMMGDEDDFLSELSVVQDAVAIAIDFTPEETVKMDKTKLRALITEKGGMTSHTAILAKALGIPAIMGVEGATEKIRNHDKILVDACAGTVTISPDSKSLAAFRVLQEKYDAKRNLYNMAILFPADTLDGYHVDVNVNVGDVESINSFCPKKCDGVGLFRTEFLYMNQKHYPDEETQFATYKKIAQKANGKEVIIRTLDIGGDKPLDYMNLPDENNPSLGYRAIRICLDQEDIFHTQLRAILRASAFGNIKIMFPMIVNLEELISAKKYVEKAKASLEREGIPYRKDIAIGIMVETPAAVLISDKLAAECDFFSIGSNDLIQYITASDRTNKKVHHLYDNCNISVLRAIQITAKNALKHGIPWGICGEAASDGRLVPLWVAMGVTELSVSPSQVGYVKYLIRKLNRKDIYRHVDTILSYGTIEKVKERLKIMLEKVENS